MHRSISEIPSSSFSSFIPPLSLRGNPFLVQTGFSRDTFLSPWKYFKSHLNRWTISLCTQDKEVILKTMVDFYMILNKNSATLEKKKKKKAHVYWLGIKSPLVSYLPDSSKRYAEKYRLISADSNFSKGPGIFKLDSPQRVCFLSSYLIQESLTRHLWDSFKVPWVLSERVWPLLDSSSCLTDAVSSRVHSLKMN